MIERPIKKSDRQAVPQSNDVVEKVIKTESLEERDITLPRKDHKISRKEPQERPEPQERQNRQDRQNRQKEEFSSRTPVNPALVRGPKPTKPKPPVIPALNEATEADAIEPPPSDP